MTPDQYKYNVGSFGDGSHFDSTLWDPVPQITGAGASWKHPSDYSYPSSTHGFPNGTVDLSGQLPWTPMEPMPPAPTHPQELYKQQHPHHHHHHYLPEAAAKLLNNTHSSRNPRHNPSLDKSRRASDFSLPQPAVDPPPMGQVRHQPLDEFLDGMWTDTRRGSTGTMPISQHDNTNNNNNTPSTEFQWGSDANFTATGGYTRDASKDTIDLMNKEKPAFPSFLEVTDGAADTTRPGSPPILHAPRPSNARRWTQPVLPKAWMDLDTENNNNNTPSPRKRRKTAIEGASKEEQRSGNTDTNTAKKERRKRPKPSTAIYPSPPTSTAGSGARKQKQKAPGAAAVSRPRVVRESLTEEQKRENHIRSEHKRRKLIKDGFDDLCKLVPGLRVGEFSKSSMLAMAAKWLEELLEGNEALDAQLAGLEGAR